MELYDHKKIEKKWREEWDENKTYATEHDLAKPKAYVLDMFPYPSGEGLHVGHPKGYIATDIYSRMKRMQGHNVLHPMGWDAFGLPAEQFAIKNKIHPKGAVEKNVARFKEQLAMIGFDHDWSREINTTDPKFYKWTQWIFKQLFKKGLAVESYEPINWCPVDKTGLSNEDLEDGKCERCGTKVEKKMLRQWKLLITKYADRMLEDLEGLDWPESIKESQRNWIGRSEGAEIEFRLNVPGEDAGKHAVTVFTTRPDTLLGATFLAISHELAQKWMDVGWNPDKAVKQFVMETKTEEEERAATFSELKEKKGIFTGVTAVHPITREEVPVWAANYVLSGYGTGAIMAVPAHDERDYAFAKSYSIPIKRVIEPTVVHPDVIGKGALTKKKKVIVVLEHDGKYCSIKWKPELGGRLFIGGTIEEGEGVEETVRREILEETGYGDIEILEIAPETFHYDYYAYAKEAAFSADISFVHARLNSENRVAQKLETPEEGNFVVEWVSKETAAKEIVNPPHRYALERYILDIPYCDLGILLDSGEFSGMNSEEAMIAITKAVNGKLTSTYKLKEWVFARQRYWGEPFPIVFDAEHKAYVVADSELPVVLPEVEAYEPTGTGESPLANIRDWVEVYGILNTDGEFVSCDRSAPGATLYYRETNTMPQWAGSSWYYLRYIDPDNDTALVDKKLEQHWSPVDFYVGGAEHATRHLIYARFWHKFLYDIGVVNHKEPFTRLQNVGLIQAEDGRKMSKRWGNVINPDDMVERFGADSLRLYEMFMGPFDQAIAWNTESMMGARRFIERVWRMSERVSTSETSLDNQTEALLHQTIKKVSHDIERFAFNTAIAQLMILQNHFDSLKVVGKDTWQIYLQLLAPFVPHVTDELWHTVGNADSIHRSLWPKYDEAKTLTGHVTIAVQVNGKLRETLILARGTKEEEVMIAALASAQVKKWLDGKEIAKVIYVQDKLLSIVIRG